MHIKLPPPGPRFAAWAKLDPLVALEQAYEQLGWIPAGGATPQRQAVLVGGGGDFISVYDSTCMVVDDGTLQAVAARLSQTLLTTVIFTALAEADDFAFILFHHGRQLDAAVGDPDEAAAGLRMVRGGEQAALWQATLGGGHVRRLTAGDGDRLSDPAALFVARAGEAARTASDGADRLAAWCALAGLPSRLVLTPEKMRGPVTRIDLIARPRRARRAQSAPNLAYEALPELFAYHAFYPASWPVWQGAQGFTWPVLCRGGGISDLRLTVHIDRTGPCTVERVTVAAYRYQNGQILSSAPLAHFGQTLAPDVAAAESDIACEITPFQLPAPGGGADVAYMLLVRVELCPGARGGCMITPALRLASTRAAPLILPTLRLAVTRPAWVPIVADPLDEDATRREALLRLNAPSLHSAVAILADSGEDVRARVRFLFEQLCLPLIGRPLVAHVHTQKHMQPGFKLARASRTVPMHNLLHGAAWEKMFRSGSNIQSLRIEIAVPDAAHALAGLALQVSLRDEKGEHQAGAAFGGHTVAASAWMVAEPSAAAALGLTRATVLNRFTAWVRGAAPLQAWAGDCAWIPNFDCYDQYVLTPYEAASNVDWARLDLPGRLTDSAWVRRRLRCVAPLLWLGWELAQHVDTAALAGFAQVVAIDDGVEISLRNAADLNRLEAALAKILPLGL